MEAWIKPAALSGIRMVAGKWNDGDREYEIQLWSGKVRFYAYSSVPGYIYAESSTTLTVDTWYHVAGVYDGANLQVYINGSADGSPTAFTASIPNTNAQFTIGAQYWASLGGWQRFFNGIIDEVRIWDEARTANQVFQSYMSYIAPDIEKVLIDPDDLPDTNVNDIGEVPIATAVTFTMDITVSNNTGVDLTDVVVHDRLGGELYLESATATTGTIDTWTRGKTEKWFIDWTIATLDDGESTTLTMVVQTDINPGQGKMPSPVNEYTSPGVYDLNSGATIVSAKVYNENTNTWVVIKIDIQTPSIQVEVLPPE